MKKSSSERGTIYGVGLGPGSVDLMSVRADKLIKSCNFIAFFRKAGRPGHARQIVSEILRENVKEYVMEYPVTTEIPLSDPRYKKIMTSFYDECCLRIKSVIESGEDVCVLCEGDPFFMGLSCTFMKGFDLKLLLRLFQQLPECLQHGPQLGYQ